MGGNGLSVLMFHPYHLHIDDTSQFLIEGLGVLSSLTSRDMAIVLTSRQ